MLALLAGTVQAQNQGLAISLKAGTMGPGVELSLPVGSNLGLRVGGSFLPLTPTHIEEDEDVTVKFKGDVTWGGYKGLLDIYPFRNGFRLTAGAYVDIREVKATGKPLSAMEIDGKEFSPERLGSVSATLTYDQAVSPYVGFGFGDPTRRGRVGFLFEAGVIYTGEPTFEMSGTGMMAPTANWAPTMEESIKTFTWMPVVSLGLSFRLQ
jgi:hypothetical protein